MMALIDRMMGHWGDCFGEDTPEKQFCDAAAGSPAPPRDAATLPQQSRLACLGASVHCIHAEAAAAHTASFALTVLGSCAADDVDELAQLADARPALVNCSVTVNANVTFTPLMAASARGANNALALLITRGAALDAQERHEGWTALHFAACKGRALAVEILLRAGRPHPGGARRPAR